MIWRRDPDERSTLPSIFFTNAGQFTMISIGALSLSPPTVLTRKRWPSALTSKLRGWLVTNPWVRMANSSTGVPARNSPPTASTGTAITLPSALS